MVSAVFETVQIMFGHLALEAFLSFSAREGIEMLHVFGTGMHCFVKSLHFCTFPLFMPDFSC